MEIFWTSTLARVFVPWKTKGPARRERTGPWKTVGADALLGTGAF